TTAFKGFFQIQLIEFKHSLYAGGLSIPLQREVFSRGQAVIVLLYDLALEQVVLVEQCRAGAVRHALSANQPESAWLLEPVAGMIDPGETAHEAGLRETQEETGITITALEYVCQYYPSPGGCDEILHLYAANISSHDLDNFGGLSQEGEDIRVVKLPFEEAKSGLLSAEYKVASTYIALQWLFYQKLSN
ncbi:MAG: NUDIX domain-containing protein, partial [Gammaproteobacteria bacterium]|nr:NUDIX domain-containing protein [Gammaproteobacteria bacterium]